MFQVYMSNKWSWFGRLILNFDVVFIFACEFRRRCVFFCNSTLGLVSAMNFGKCVPLGILMFYFFVACIPFSFIESDRILETTTILDGFRVVITPIASFSDVESTLSMPWLPSRFPAARATTS